MTNTITLIKLSGGFWIPDTGRGVSVYAYHASDAADGAPNGALIGACGEIAGMGQYTIDIAVAQKVTVAVDGKCKAGLIGRLLNGETALADSVDTAAIEDEAVTPEKTSFGEAFS